MIPGPPMSWHLEAPNVWLQLSPEEKTNSELLTDQCVIENRDFLVRGVIEIPVLDGPESFSWGVWVSLSEANYKRAAAAWNDPRRVNEPAYFGWLCNSLPDYPETLNLKTMVHTREVGLRSLIELEPTDHPLAVEQRKGITMSRVREIAEKIHHHNNRREDLR